MKLQKGDLVTKRLSRATRTSLHPEVEELKMNLKEKPVRPVRKKNYWAEVEVSNDGNIQDILNEFPGVSPRDIILDISVEYNGYNDVPYATASTRYSLEPESKYEQRLYEYKCSKKEYDEWYQANKNAIEIHHQKQKIKDREEKLKKIKALKAEIKQLEKE